MKRLKFAMVAVILASVMIAYAGVDPPTVSQTHKVVKISLVQAVEDPGLLEAMIAQLDISMLYDDVPVYIGHVTYEKVDYLIYGTFKEWEWFFDTFN